MRYRPWIVLSCIAVAGYVWQIPYVTSIVYKLIAWYDTLIVFIITMPARDPGMYTALMYVMLYNIITLARDDYDDAELPDA